MKPFDVKQLAELVRKKTEGSPYPPKLCKDNVASVLERDTNTTIKRWLARVGRTEELTHVPLSDEDRMGHLPELTEDVISRLRGNRVLEAVASKSPAAAVHGELRYRQGYTASLMVQESRILQVSIFETIERNMGNLDFSRVLPDIMLIADEVDSQLTQSLDSFLKAQQGSAGSPST